MPFVAAALVTGWVAGALAAGTLIAFSMSAFLTSLVLGGIQYAMQKKPKSPDASAFQAQGRMLTVRQPTASYQIVVGEARVGGDVTFMDASEDNMTLWMVITFAGHVSFDIGDIYFNDELVLIDPATGLAYGKWHSKVHILKSLGDEVGQPWPDLVTDTGGRWSTDHCQTGFTKIAVKLIHDAELFSGGIPNITAVIKGAKVYDPRSDTTIWTPNVALVTSAYITEAALGLGADYDTEIDEDDLIASANVCDERVSFADYTNTFTASAEFDSIALPANTRRLLTGQGVRLASDDTLPTGLTAGLTYYVITITGGNYRLATSYANALAHTYVSISDEGIGTHTLTYWDEPRYQSNGAFRVNTRPREIMLDMLATMSGKAVNVGGKWHILAGAYEAPTVTLDESDLAGPVEVQGLVSAAENCNAVKGMYIDPSSAWQATDFPPIESDAYMAEDNGERRWRDLDLTAFTQSSSQAQRIAKIELLRTRQALTCRYPGKLSCFRAQTGRTVYIKNEKFGWTGSGKAFDVMNSRFTCADNVLGCELILRETAAQIYDWSTSEEQLGDFAPNARMPGPEFGTGLPPDALPILMMPQHLRIREWAIPQTDGTYTTRIEVEFDPVTYTPIDHYEVEYALLPVGTPIDLETISWTPWQSGTATVYVHDALSGLEGELVVRAKAVGENGVDSVWAVAIRTLNGEAAIEEEITLPSPTSSIVYAAWKSETQTAKVRLRLDFDEYVGELPDGVLFCYSVWDHENGVTVIDDDGVELKVIAAQDVLMASFGTSWPTGAPLTTLAGTNADRLVIFPTPLSDQDIARVEPSQWYVAVGSDWRKVSSFEPTAVVLDQSFTSNPGVGATVQWAKLDWSDARRYEFRLGFAEVGSDHEIVRWNRLENRGGEDFYLTNVSRALEGTTQLDLTGQQLCYYPAPGAGTRTVDFPLSTFKPVDGDSGAYEATVGAEITVPPGAYVSMTAVLYKRQSNGAYVRSAIVPTTYGGLLQ